MQFLNFPKLSTRSHLSGIRGFALSTPPPVGPVLQTPQSSPSQYAKGSNSLAALEKKRKLLQKLCYMPSHIFTSSTTIYRKHTEEERNQFLGANWLFRVECAPLAGSQRGTEARKSKQTINVREEPQHPPIYSVWKFLLPKAPFALLFALPQKRCRLLITTLIIMHNKW